MGRIGFGYGIEGRGTIVAEAEELNGVLLVVLIGASSPQDIIRGTKHDAAAGLEEDVGQRNAVAGEEGPGRGGYMPLTRIGRWIALADELFVVDLL